MEGRTRVRRSLNEAAHKLGYWPVAPEKPKDTGPSEQIRDAQTNAGGQRLDCSKLARLEVGLPAHSAPLGFHFLIGSKLPARWADGAVVAGHGSWDRHPPRPPVVYWMPWNGGDHTLGAPQVLISGFQEPNGDRWARLADAVPGPDGALYVSDDLSGAILRVVPAAGS